MTNMTTPGYKSRSDFSGLISVYGEIDKTNMVNSANAASIDFAPGKMQTTGNPFDFAISGSGFFSVRSGDSTLYTRSGQFHRDADGRLLTPEGLVLQGIGGDVVVAEGDISLLADGTLLQAGQPVARLAIADFSDLQALRPTGAGMFAAAAGVARDAASPQIRQGMLEASNVSASGEMLSMMAALRSAESGARVVQVYDDLMGRAVTVFGGT